MWWVVWTVLFVWLQSLAAAQQPPPPPCQVQLAQALQRSITFQETAAQEREAIATYFREELRKMTAERDEAQRKLDELHRPGPPPPPAASAK